MKNPLKLSRQQLSQVNWQAVIFFYVLACGLSYGLHFLPNLDPGFLPRHNIFTYGLGPISAAIITRLLFRSVPRTITWTGTKPIKTALFIGIPLLVGTAFGLTNKSGQNVHVYGFLVVVSGILYGFVEEAGWRGFLQDTVRPLPTFWRVVLIGTLWMGWHFTFLSDLSAVVEPDIPAWGVCMAFMLGSWGLGDAADKTKAVLVPACLHEVFNLVRSPVALVIIGVSWTLLLIFWDRPRIRVAFRSSTVFSGVLLLILAGHCAVAQVDSTVGTMPHEEIHPGQPNQFTLFDDAFYQNQLFLLGESHGVQKPQDIDFELLKHLNQKVGVRYYIAEVDGTKAYYMNQYLQTGDEQTLMKVFRSWVDEKLQWANRDFFRKIQKIRVLNQTLPSTRQIQFVGIDRIQDKALAAEHLSQLIKGRKLSRVARPLADSLTKLLAQNGPDSLVSTLALTWLSDWQTNASTSPKTANQDTAALRDLLTNVGYLKTIKSRETTIFANFKTILPRLNGEKLYGFWGFFHVLQSSHLKRGKPFACLVKESGIQVVSITCSYLDSYMMVPTDFMPPFWQEKGKTYSRLNKFNNDSEFMHTEGIEAMRAATRPNSLTLFALDRPGSLARQTPIRIKYAPFMPPSQRMEFDPQLPTTAYFQYVILIRDSDMTEPLVP